MVRPRGYDASKASSRPATQYLTLLLLGELISALPLPSTCNQPLFRRRRRWRRRWRWRRWLWRRWWVAVVAAVAVAAAAAAAAVVVSEVCVDTEVGEGAEAASWPLSFATVWPATVPNCYTACACVHLGSGTRSLPPLDAQFYSWMPYPGSLREHRHRLL